MKKIVIAATVLIVLLVSLANAQQYPISESTLPLERQGTIILYPDSSSLRLGSEGGFVYFNAMIRNHNGNSTRGFVWGEIEKLYTGKTWEPFLLNSIAIGSRSSKHFEEVSFYVPECMQAGRYKFIGKIGCYPNVVHADTFYFEKEQAGESGYMIEECNFLLMHTNTNLHPDDVTSDCMKIDDDEEVEIPNNIQISQIYPNPFNATTMMIFNIEKPMIVKIKAVNLIGQVIEEISEQYYFAGRHEITWDASKYSSGVYFLKFEAGNQSDARKVTLLK
ncbi:MAG: T9SS type A sorting domain-containing protein [candidate division Zixibacteria bacterium]|nr:T9SS type A sorting domain-containing protein [candidate division Zixibacteria bacterium]